MIYSKLSRASLTIFLVFFSFISLAQAETELPPILDYYPNCEYEVVDKTKVKIITDTPLSNKIVERLLNKIKVRALKADADAIILTGKRVKNYVDPSKGLGNSNNSSNSNNALFSRMGQGKANYLVRYHAELINLCEEDGKGNNNEKRKRTPLNHQGIKIIDVESRIVSTKKATITIASKIVVERPIMNNDEVSLENGIYGVAMGSSYQHVVNSLGEPSVKLQLMVDEVVLGYGRRHWFYFQSDKLVKIQNNSVNLSQEMVNKVPLLDFFDDFPWQINQKVGYKVLLEDVRTALNITADLNNKDQLILKDNENTLALNFIFNKDKYTLEKSYELSGFTLQANSYKKETRRIAERSKTQFKVIGDLYSQLLDNQDINQDALLKQLGAPIGVISLSQYADLQIYNNNLLVLVKREEVRKIYLIENALANVQSQQWSLGKIKQGSSVTKNQKHLAKEALVLDDKIEVNTDNYALSLMFEELQGEAVIYEAELTLY